MSGKTKVTQNIYRFVTDGRAAVLVIFLLLILWGARSYNDYGLAVDDEVQRYHSLVTYKELFLKEEYETETITTAEIPSLERYNVFYGVTLQLPLVFVEHIFDFQLSYAQIFEIRHAYIFMWLVIAAFFFYRTCMVLTEKKRWLSICGLLIFVLNPRTLVEACYNVKDMLCLPLYTIAMYYGIRILTREKSRDVLWFGIAAALCTSVRIVGGTLLAVLCIVLLGRGIAGHNMSKQIRKIAALCYVFGLSYFTCMPKLWNMVFGQNIKKAVLMIAAGILAGLIVRMGFVVQNKYGKGIAKKYFGGLAAVSVIGLCAGVRLWLPIASNLLQGIGKIFSVFGNYSVWDGDLFYWGEWILGLELPWHYLFVWIGISVPAAYILLFFVGAGVQIGAVTGSIKEKKMKNSVAQYCLWLWLIPVIYVLVVNPVLYNGWRHMYFLYNVIALTAVMGLDRLLRIDGRKLWTAVVSGLLCVSFGMTGVWLVRNHPYEYTYFNPVVRSWAVKNFDLDYWCMAEQKCLQYMLDAEPDKRTINFMATAGITAGVDPQGRLNRMDSWKDADYVSIGCGGFEGDYYFDDVYAVYNDDGSVINRVWKRIYETIECSILMLDGDGNLSQSLGNLQWRKTEENGKVMLVGKSDRAIPTDRLAVFLKEELLADTEITVSSDGKVWYNISDFSQYRTYENRVSADCSVHDLCYIRITLSEDTVNLTDESFMLRVELLGTEESKQSAQLLTPIVWVETEENRETIRWSYDGDLQTAWESGQQREGIALEVELAAEQKISGIYLDYGEKDWDYPRGLQIAISSDGESWTMVEYADADGKYFILASPYSGRYIRLSLDGAEATESHWSIYEMYIMTEAE